MNDIKNFYKKIEKVMQYSLNQQFYSLWKFRDDDYV